MKDLIRDATVGQWINSLSGGRLLPYADQRDGYVVPDKYLLASGQRSPTATVIGDTTPPKEKTSRPPSGYVTPLTPALTIDGALSPSNASIRTLVRDSTISANTTATLDKAECRLRTAAAEKDGHVEDGSPVCEKFREEKISEKLHPELAKVVDPYLVDWDGPNDQDNPMNWSTKKKAFVAGSISLLTFSGKLNPHYRKVQLITHLSFSIHRFSHLHQ